MIPFEMNKGEPIWLRFWCQVTTERRLCPTCVIKPYHRPGRQCDGQALLCHEALVANNHNKTMWHARLHFDGCIFIPHLT